MFASRYALLTRPDAADPLPGLGQRVPRPEELRPTPAEQAKVDKAMKEMVFENLKHPEPPAPKQTKYCPVLQDEPAPFKSTPALQDEPAPFKSTPAVLSSDPLMQWPARISAEFYEELWQLLRKAFTEGGHPGALSRFEDLLPVAISLLPPNSMSRRSNVFKGLTPNSQRLRDLCRAIGMLREPQAPVKPILKAAPTRSALEIERQVRETLARKQEEERGTLARKQEEERETFARKQEEEDAAHEFSAYLRQSCDASAL